MNLIIDIGNTFAKIAVVDPQGDLLFKEVFRALSCETVGEILEQHPGIEAAILSTTRHNDPALENYLEKRIARFIRFGSGTPIPIANRYATPETLGADRLASAVGAWDIAPGNNLLVVDFGSAITIDRVNSEGEYLGGNISPGMAMRFEALHRLTDRLPLCHATSEVKETGDSTQSAIESGVILGICREIEGYIFRIEAETTPFELFFTGRDANFFALRFEGSVKKPIFVACDLVIKGLNRILEYNTQHV